MSASLVGSEMCIRDRKKPPSIVTVNSPLSKFGWSGAAAKANGLPASPVSYTHLTLPTICSV
eukprot:883645-Alexandrium_andersonii.AAC.1